MATKLFKIPQKILANGAKFPMYGLGTYQISPENFTEVVETAVKSGIRHFDTASFYFNFDQLNVAFQNIYQKNLAKREDLFVVSKVWMNEQRKIRETCTRSLKEIGMDYFDCLLVHWPYCYKEDKDGNRDIDFIPRHFVWAQFESLVEEGLVKHIGVSNYNTIAMYDLLSYSKIKPVCNQVENHIYNQQPELVEFCQKYGVVVTAYAPLGTNALQDDTGRKFNVFEDPVLKQLGQKYKVDLAQIMLAYQVQRGVALIPKSSNPKRIVENLNALELKIEDSDMDLIAKLDQGLRVFNTHFDYYLPLFK